MAKLEISASLVFIVLLSCLVTTIIYFVIDAFEEVAADPDPRVAALEAVVETQQAQLNKLEGFSAPTRARMGRGFNPGNRNQTMPKYRADCWRGDLYMKKQCP